MVYAMRRPSGESSTLPTERKREISLLARPWAPPQGAIASRTTAERKPETERRKTKRDCECMRFPPNFSKTCFLLRSGQTGNCLFQMLIHPFDPVSVNVHLANGVAGKVSEYGDGDEFHLHAVVLQRVVEGISLRDGHAGVAGVVHDERRSFHLRGVGDG